MPQTSSNQGDNAHALLIGVDDYTSFDGNGGSNLKGSRNDVFLLASYCVEVLGMRPENITALITPELTSKERDENKSLRGIDWGDAGEAAVKAGLASLLGVAGKGALLLAFSGHGAALPGGEPVLCLGDSAPGLTSGVLSLKTLRDDIKKAYAEGRVIALLDCCHVAAPSTHPRLRGTSLSHGVTGEEVADQEDLFRVSDRVLLAALPGQQAYQVRLGNGWHGAFTFALVTAADRWQGENEMSHGSYKEVRERAKNSLKALGVPQKSELRVPDARFAEIRNQPFLGVTEGKTVKEPDAVVLSTQLQPDWLITIRLDSSTGTVLTQIVTMGGSHHRAVFSQNDHHATWGGTSEIWYMNTTALKGLSFSTSKIFITSQKLSVDATGALVVALDDHTTFAFGGPVIGQPVGTFGIGTYSSVESAPWTPGAPTSFDPSSSNYYFTESSNTADPGMVVQLNVPALGSTTLTAVQWYKVYSSVPPTPPTDIQPGSATGIEYGRTSAPALSSSTYSAVSSLIAQ